MSKKLLFIIYLVPMVMLLASIGQLQLLLPHVVNTETDITLTFLYWTISISFLSISYSLMYSIRKR